ncbi:hypothetical protein TREES_T100003351 [Tupaia chinensis]|uniref:Uncharacterized protein n=1 Tax=Tupaia chinensis TaxID=246437 RepID=L9JBU2_TUPCH|nr:hypothetical protein TREES_T100003351 [Tupaia chinensis]
MAGTVEMQWSSEGKSAASLLPQARIKQEPNGIQWMTRSSSPRPYFSLSQGIPKSSLFPTLIPKEWQEDTRREDQRTAYLEAE